MYVRFYLSSNDFVMKNNHKIMQALANLGVKNEFVLLNSCSGKNE